MKEKMEDRRVSRTRGMLLDALLDLMIEKGYEAVTVQDIIDRANVGRSTFYLHFTDKEQLLSCSIDQLKTFLKEQGLNRLPSEASDQHRFGFSLAMLQHAQSHKRLYRAIVKKKSETLVMYHMQRMLEEIIHDEIAVLIQSLSAPPIPQEVIVDFTANTFLTLLTWWMDQNMPCPAADVDRMFHKLALNGLYALR